LGGFDAGGNAIDIVVLGLIGSNGSLRVPFATNEKGSMVVVVARGVNGSKGSVVVATVSSSKLIGKGMVGGGGETLIAHRCIVCKQIWKFCADILRSLSTQHSPNQYHYVFSLLT
jgi:hypothetical protein